MLTPQQAKCLIFIDEQIKATGFSPSFDDVREYLGLASRSGVHRLVSMLVDRGFIAHTKGRRRSLEVLRLPDGHANRFSLLLLDRALLADRPDIDASSAGYWLNVNALSPSSARHKAWHHMAVEKDVTQEAAEERFDVLLILKGWHAAEPIDAIQTLPVGAVPQMSAA